MDLELNINIADIFHINNIIFGNNSRGEQVRGHLLTSSNTRNRSNMLSIKPDSGDEFYHNKVQQESNNMVKDEPVVMSDSPQLEYTTSQEKHLALARWLIQTQTWGKNIIKILCPSLVKTLWITTRTYSTFNWIMILIRP